MGQTTDKFRPAIPVLLLSLVVTQFVYVVFSENGLEINRPVIWSVEAVAFMGLAVLAMMALARNGHLAAAWAAIAVSGVLNIIQVGTGLSMFGPLSEAGEAIAPVYSAVVAGAFFLYFAGKFLFGFAAIIIGADLLRGSGVAKATGVIAMIAGLAAMAVNLGGMAMGMTMVFPAGAAGTAATFMLAVALIMTERRGIEAKR